MTRRIRDGFAASVFLFLCVTAGAQTANGFANGQVLCADGNAPARRAEVEFVPVESLLPGAAATATSGSRQSAETDFHGFYEIASVPPGVYLVGASLDGYTNDLDFVGSILKRYSAEEQKKLLATLPQVTVKAGSTAREDLVLHRAAAVSGRVTVDTGGVANNTVVQADRIAGNLPGLPLAPQEAPVRFSRRAVTDDRGVYRIVGLPPGIYRVSVQVKESYFKIAEIEKGKFYPEPQRSGVAELTVFANEALQSSDARSVTLEDGDEIQDVNIAIPESRLHSISGVVTRNGAPAGNIVLYLRMPDGSEQPTNAISMSDGSYRFDLLPSGNYTVEARPLGEPRVDKAPPPVGTVHVILGESDVLDADFNLRTAR